MNNRLKQLKHEKSLLEASSVQELPLDVSSRPVRGKIEAVNLIDEQGNASECFMSGSILTVSIKVKAFDHIAKPSVAFMIRNLYGHNLLGVNTFYEKFPVKPMHMNEERTFLLSFKLSLFSGNYLTSVGFADQEDFDLVYPIELLADKTIIQINGDARFYGLCLPESVRIEEH